MVRPSIKLSHELLIHWKSQIAYEYPLMVNFLLDNMGSNLQYQLYEFKRRIEYLNEFLTSVLQNAVCDQITLTLQKIMPQATATSTEYYQKELMELYNSKIRASRASLQLQKDLLTFLTDPPTAENTILKEISDMPAPNHQQSTQQKQQQSHLTINHTLPHLDSSSHFSNQPHSKSHLDHCNISIPGPRPNEQFQILQLDSSMQQYDQDSFLHSNPLNLLDSTHIGAHIQQQDFFDQPSCHSVLNVDQRGQGKSSPFDETSFQFQYQPQQSMNQLHESHQSTKTIISQYQPPINLLKQTNSQSPTSQQIHLSTFDSPSLSVSVSESQKQWLQQSTLSEQRNQRQQFYSQPETLHTQILEKYMESDQIGSEPTIHAQQQQMIREDVSFQQQERRNNCQSVNPCSREYQSNQLAHSQSFKSSDQQLRYPSSVNNQTINPNLINSNLQPVCAQSTNLSKTIKANNNIGIHTSNINESQYEQKQAQAQWQNPEWQTNKSQLNNSLSASNHYLDSNPAESKVSSPLKVERQSIVPTVQVNNLRNHMNHSLGDSSYYQNHQRIDSLQVSQQSFEGRHLSESTSSTFDQNSLSMHSSTTFSAQTAYNNFSSHQQKQITPTIAIQKQNSILPAADGIMKTSSVQQAQFGQVLGQQTITQAGNVEEVRAPVIEAGIPLQMNNLIEGEQKIEEVGALNAYPMSSNINIRTQCLDDSGNARLMKLSPSFQDSDEDLKLIKNVFRQTNSGFGLTTQDTIFKDVQKFKQNNSNLKIQAKNMETGLVGFYLEIVDKKRRDFEELILRVVPHKDHPYEIHFCKNQESIPKRQIPKSNSLMDYIKWWWKFEFLIENDRKNQQNNSRITSKKENPILAK